MFVSRFWAKRRGSLFVFAVLTVASITNLSYAPPVFANLATLVDSNIVQASGTTASTTLTSVTAGNLIVVVCASKNNSTMSVSTPTGFSTAISQSGTPSQAIFYKEAVAGQNTYTCTFSANAPAGIQVFEYSGFVSPISGVQTSSAVGTSSAYNINSVTTTTADRLLIGAFIVNTGSNAPTWTNSFTNILDSTVSSGNPNGRFAIGSSQLLPTTTGTYGSVGTGTGNDAWRGQIVSFEAEPRELTIGIVDAGGAPVASPSFAMAAQTTQYVCQTSTGTLGTSTQRLRIKNTTLNAAWSLSIAATAGATARWTSGGNTYHYNNAAGAGCTDGQLTLNIAGATLTPQSGCTTTGLTLGGNQAFSDPSLNTISLLSASSAANLNCYWDLTNIGLSQEIPAERPAGTYSLNLTATVVAL